MIKSFSVSTLTKPVNERYSKVDKDRTQGAITWRELMTFHHDVMSLHAPKLSQL